MPFSISNLSFPLEELSKGQKKEEPKDQDSFRSLCFKSGVFDEKRGSAYVEFGETRVLVQINGPKEDGDADYRSGTVLIVLKGCENEKIRAQLESAMSGCIRLDKYAKSVIEIEISVVSAAQGILQAALIASSLALIHAGIELLDVILAAHVVITESDTFILDPADLPPKVKASVTIGVMPSRNQIVCTDIRGALTSRIVNEVIGYATKQALRLYPLMRKTIVSSLS